MMRTAIQTRHTPGPWSVDEKGFVYADDLVTHTTVTGEDGIERPHKTGLVALLYTPLIPNERPDFRANAHLTAAAPDLLSAAMALLESWDNGTPVHPGAEVVGDLREAVAKATAGRTEEVAAVAS
jgi:hypothetical protein